MIDLRKAAEMALDALRLYVTMYPQMDKCYMVEAREALRTALAQSDNQEPVAHLWECIGRWSSYLALNGEKANLAPPEWLVAAVKAATAPPRKEWVGLTEEEMQQTCYETWSLDPYVVAQAIQEKLRSKNEH